MDEEKNVAEVNSVSKIGKRIRRGPRNRSRNHPYYKSRFLVHQQWTLTEKSRLLEALKRYEPHNITSIAKVVETKSEEEVEEKLDSLRGNYFDRYYGERVDGRGSDEAPVETWIDLVQEMITFESADYSQFVPRVLGLIARNEQFSDSGHPDVKWKNIYQFLADITEDKVNVHKLTDLEYLIVLDMMHNMGDALMKSDTLDQRQILDFKYNLLNFKSGNASKTERETVVHNIAQALSNDFWEPEDMQSLLSHASSSTATSSSQPSSNSVTAPMVRIGMTNESPASTTNLQTSSTQETIPEANTSSTSTGQASSSQQTSDPQGAAVAGTKENNKASSGVGLLHAQGPGERFLRPKYFTLNPLCVPTQLLAFRQKTWNY